jgi:hypothetical protein
MGNSKHAPPPVDDEETGVDVGCGDLSHPLEVANHGRKVLCVAVWQILKRDRHS